MEMCGGFKSKRICCTTWATMRLITERFLHLKRYDISFPWFASCLFLCSKSESMFRTVYKTGTVYNTLFLQSDRTFECLSFNLFITVPFYRFSRINTLKHTTEYASFYTQRCIRLSTLYWNVDHVFFFFFFVKKR